MTHKGSCHCGRVAFEADGDIAQLLECNCSHCSRKGFLLWFVPRQDFRLTTPEAELTTYTFNKHVIRHQFCPTCGCQPFAYGKAPNGGDMVAVNVRCLPELDRSSIKVVPFDGRSK
jgi:hypothetical protein